MARWRDNGDPRGWGRLVMALLTIRWQCRHVRRRHWQIRFRGRRI
ncbi:hypothetical protein [Enterobacter phage 01_vB_Eclo_IJM]|nr:hypothetical protein [Enterobacter phage 01_vB_Eclo_IJM]